MNKLGIVVILALTSSAAGAETFNIPIGNGKLRIDARECGGRICANVSFSNGNVRLGNHQFTIDKSTIERLVPKSKSEDETPVLPNNPPSAAPAQPAPQATPAQPVQPYTSPYQAPAPQAAPAQAAPAPQAAVPAQPYTSPYRAPQPAVAEPAPVEPSRPAIAAVPPATEPAPAPAKVLDPNSPIGEWITEKGEGRIRIEECGSNLCGYAATAKPNETDSKNPNPALRGRPMLGLPILINMKPTKPNRWDGKIYNSRDGGTYTSHMAMRNSNTLRVEGCLIMFCGGQNWTRAQ